MPPELFCCPNTGLSSYQIKTYNYSGVFEVGKVITVSEDTYTFKDIICLSLIRAFTREAQDNNGFLTIGGNGKIIYMPGRTSDLGVLQICIITLK